MTEAGAPTVSVFMPVLNGEPFLSAAMESIRAQTLRDLELIVVDNGSTDASRHIVRAAAAEDPRVRLLELPAPDLAGALNAGVAAARAPFVARMDADDVARPQRLERELAVLARHPDVAAVSCAYLRIDEEGRPLGVVRMPTRREGLGDLLRHQCLFSSSGALMRRDAVLSVGGFRPEFPPTEDFDLWLRLLDSGWQLENLPDVLIEYREVATGLTRTRSELQDRNALRAVVESRLRGLKMTDGQIGAIGIDPRRGIEEVDDCPIGLRLLIEGFDLNFFADAGEEPLRRAATAVESALAAGAYPDPDLALIAYRIATRFRELRAPIRAARWYWRAARVDWSLARVLFQRSVRGLVRGQRRGFNLRR